MSERVPNGDHDNISKENFRLYGLAEQTIDDPEASQLLERWKKTYAGEEALVRDDRSVHREYGLQVFTGFDPQTGDLLSVRKDHYVWEKDGKLDPTMLLIARGNLNTGKVQEYYTQEVTIDDADQVRAQVIDPAAVSNWPPYLHPQMHEPSRNKTSVNFRVDEQFHTLGAEYRAGLYGEHFKYEPLDVLLAMRDVIKSQRESQEAEGMLHSLREDQHHDVTTGELVEQVHQS